MKKFFGPILAQERKRNPYGIASFETLRRTGYVFVDRTPFNLILRPAEGCETAPEWLIEFKFLKKTDAGQSAVDERLLEAEAH